MLDIANARSRLDVVAETVRTRICLSDPDAELVLHEGALAAEFGLSRTPIRQVLQRLAYERLVKTKSGVGTIAVPLNEAERAGYVRVHQGILRAIIDCEPLDLSIQQRSEIVALANVVRRQPMSDVEQHFDARNRLLVLLGGTVRDPILLDAHLASHWRVVRCDIRDYLRAPAKTGRRLSRLIAAVAETAEVGTESPFQALLNHDLQG